MLSASWVPDDVLVFPTVCSHIICLQTNDQGQLSVYLEYEFFETSMIQGGDLSRVLHEDVGPAGNNTRESNI